MLPMPMYTIRLRACPLALYTRPLHVRRAMPSFPTEEDQYIGVSVCSRCCATFRECCMRLSQHLSACSCANSVAYKKTAHAEPLKHKAGVSEPALLAIVNPLTIAPSMYRPLALAIQVHTTLLHTPCFSTSDADCVTSTVYVTRPSLSQQYLTAARRLSTAGRNPHSPPCALLMRAGARKCGPGGCPCAGQLDRGAGGAVHILGDRQARAPG